MLQTLCVDFDLIGRFIHGLHLFVAVIGPVILILPFVAFEETATHYLSSNIIINMNTSKNWIRDWLKK